MKALHMSKSEPFCVRSTGAAGGRGTAGQAGRDDATERSAQHREQETADTGRQSGRRLDADLVVQILVENRRRLGQ